MTNAPEYSMGVDIGGTRVKSVAVAADGALLYSTSTASDDAADGWRREVPAVVAATEAALGPAGCIGVSSPGLARRDHRAIAWMRGRLAGIEGFDWTDALSRDRTVPVLNDAHAAMLGEAWLGAAKGARDAVLITLGTGVGGAILCDGRLLEGHLGRAGHLGHLSLDRQGMLDIVNTPGSLEDAVGEHTLESRSNGRFRTTVELLEAHAAGNMQAHEIWMRSVQALAAGIASIINVVDPAIVVIGGGIAAAGERLFAPLRERLDVIEWRPTGRTVPVVAALLGEWAGAYGAARFALDFETERAR